LRRTHLKKAFLNYRFLFLIAGVIIVLDQWTKWLVKTSLPNPGDYWSPWPWLTPYARIIHWTNTGAAFGIFQGFGDVFSVMAIIVSLGILYYFPQVPNSEWPLRLAMGLQLGGAVGNLIDRLDQGHVTDFVSVGNFAVFNVADACISTGVVVLVLGVWIREQVQKKTLPPDPAGAGTQAGDSPASQPVEGSTREAEAQENLPEEGEASAQDPSPEERSVE
jgi:signal peptidase II